MEGGGQSTLALQLGKEVGILFNANNRDVENQCEEARKICVARSNINNHIQGLFGTGTGTELEDLERNS